MKISKGSRASWFPLPRAWRAHAVETPGAVLLETAGGMGSEHTSFLFSAPMRILRAASASELQALLTELERAKEEGFYVAGRIDYEAGYALHGLPYDGRVGTFAWFGVYQNVLIFDHRVGVASGETDAVDGTLSGIRKEAALSVPLMQISFERYAEKFARVQELLEAGDTYQVNLTTQVEAELHSSALFLYECLIETQPVDFAAIVHFDDGLVLSFSPELFFRVEDDRKIVTRPMKGTAPRGPTLAEDVAQQEWLAHDEKNRAEHVMIVDLLRNDLGRICKPGSVRVDKLFEVEIYPTLFQMTSTVSGVLNNGSCFADILSAIFPSGSITGAPKHRTMEIIRDLEDGPRGVYTGAIGFVAPNGDACFSVPIRTLDVQGRKVVMGVGGGIVADSTAHDEYDECLLKASFLKKATTAPLLIETLLWDEGYPLLQLHLSRLAKSAADLGFRFVANETGRVLKDDAASWTRAMRVRLMLSADGTTHIESTSLVGPTENLRVRIASRRMLSTDPWLQHKTTRRVVYEGEFARARQDGFDEVLFLNERDELSEGSISNVFVEIGGRLYTPPLDAGALPGVLRQHLLETLPNIEEKVLRLADVEAAAAVYLGNALRGLRSVGNLHIE